MDSDNITRWKNSTRWLTVGISINTVLMLLYNIFLFLPPRGDRGLQGGSIWLVLALSLFVLLLCYFGIMNYCRGLKRFAINFEKGGKRALWMIRWSCLLAVAGVLIQLIVFRIIPLRELTVGQIILGNILWLTATVLGIIGFLSLATVRNMNHDGRKGAAHMAWVLIILFVGACMISYALQQSEASSLLFKLLTIAVNLVGTYFFFNEWKRIIAPPAESDVEPTTTSADNSEDATAPADESLPKDSETQPQTETDAT